MDEREFNTANAFHFDATQIAETKWRQIINC